MRAWLEISKIQLQKNLILLKKDMPKGLHYFCVIKDNAFGHDAKLVAEEALKIGATYLAVSCLFEALDLEKQINHSEISKPIFLLYDRFEDELETCVEHNWTLQIQSLERAKKISELSAKQKKTTKIHLKVDTGLGRYGVAWKEAAALYLEISKIPHLELEGIMSHFAQSDEPDKSYANLQHQKFQKVLDDLTTKNISPKYIHVCNTGGYLDLPQFHHTAVRIGILNTGIYPSDSCRRIKIAGEGLKPIMSVKTRVSAVKILKKGESVGYGMHFTATQDKRIAVLPMGYGDGFPRIRNKGKVLISGEFAPILGGVSMDAIVVAIDAIEKVEVGDEVVIIGEQGEKSITVHELGSWMASLCYDQLTSWSKRMEVVIV